MTVLGIDPGIQNIGLAVIVTGRVPRVAVACTIRDVREIATAVKAHPPDYVALEEPFNGARGMCAKTYAALRESIGAMLAYAGLYHSDSVIRVQANAANAAINLGDRKTDAAKVKAVAALIAAGELAADKPPATSHEASAIAAALVVARGKGQRDA